MELAMVTQEALADAETPVSAYAKLCAGRPDSMLLESVEPHESVGRYSIVAFDPLAGLTLEPQAVRIWGLFGNETRPARDFFPLIRQFTQMVRLPGPALGPAVGSLMGLVGYDAVRLIENLGPLPDTGSPLARLVFPGTFLIFDAWRRTLTFCGLDVSESQARARVDEARKGLNTAFQSGMPQARLQVMAPPKDRYVEAVRKAKEYIRDGEIFQVVLADRFEGETSVDPFNVYRLLRVKSPSPYMFYLNQGDRVVLGASPETMVKVQAGRVILRPIAGTRPRSDNGEKDKALEAELMASEKERAEHVMLVDLARNDAGRVSANGTVAVAPYMNVERYSHVMHIVSQVTGRLKDDADAVDAFMAGFPAGTVSGAPKVRAMEIIDELETHPRGAYSGAVGYFGTGREADTCIAIRMVVFDGDRFMVPVGAGIVADSDPEMEYGEIGHKAAQSLAALRMAANGGIEPCAK